MTNTHLPLITALYEIGAVQFGEFQLKSGEITPVYMNLRKIISYPTILKALSAALWEKIVPLQYDLICGVPYAALPIASCISLQYNIPMIMCRKERKDYGTKQIIEGVYQPGQTCLIIEDVVTAGESIIETAQELKNAGLIVKDVSACVDREQGGRLQLEKQFNFHSIFVISDILVALLQTKLLSLSEKNSIDNFLLKRSA